MTPFLQLIFALMIIIAAAKAGGWIAVRLRQPAVLGELLIGVVLGPSLFDLLHWSLLLNPAEPHLLSEEIFELAELGVVCLMFLAGLEVEVDEMRRAGRVAVLSGVSGVIAPLLLGALAALPFGYRGNAAFFAGIILTATSVSISAQTLFELDALRSREGVALLGAAVVDDVLVILLLSVFLALSDSSAGLTAIGLVLLRMLLYLAGALAVAFFVLPRLVEWVDLQPISEGLIALILVATLTFAWSAEVIGGLAAITGAFVAGVGLSRSHLRGEIARGMHAITYAFLVPIFFVSIGLKTDTHLLAGPNILFAAVMVLVAIVSKVIGCGTGARLAGFTNREALRVGLGMISRGEVGLIVASVGVNAGIIEPDLFAIVTIIVLVTTLVTPLFLRQAFARKELRHA
ncbi:MAG: cation:proton antiporter [Anaerolineae bacterium]|nr:cation:proton antiporter [Anaerolineae bacterium]